MSGSLVLPAFPRISGSQQTYVVKYVCMNYFISNTYNAIYYTNSITLQYILDT